MSFQRIGHKGFALPLVLVVGIIGSFVTMVLIASMNTKVLTLKTNVDARHFNNICLSAEENIEALMRAQMMLGTLDEEQSVCPAEDLLTAAGLKIEKIRELPHQTSEPYLNGLFPLEPYESTMSKIEPRHYIFDVYDEKHDITCHVHTTTLRGTLSTFSSALTIGQSLELESFEAPSVSSFGFVRLNRESTNVESSSSLALTTNNGNWLCGEHASLTCGNLGMFRVPQFVPRVPNSFSTQSPLMQSVMTQSPLSTESTISHSALTLGPRAFSAQGDYTFDATFAKIEDVALKLHPKTGEVTFEKPLYFVNPNDGVHKPFLTSDTSKRIGVEKNSHASSEAYWGPLSAGDLLRLTLLMGQRLPNTVDEGASIVLPIVNVNLDSVIEGLYHMASSDEINLNWCSYQYGPSKDSISNLGIDDFFNQATESAGLAPGRFDTKDSKVCVTPSIEIRRNDLVTLIRNRLTPKLLHYPPAFLNSEVGFSFSNTDYIRLYEGATLRALSSMKNFNGWRVDIDTPLTLTFVENSNAKALLTTLNQQNKHWGKTSPGTFRAPQINFAPHTWHGLGWVVWPKEMKRPELTSQNACSTPSLRNESNQLTYVVGSKGLRSSKQLLRSVCKNSSIEVVALNAESGVFQGRALGYPNGNLRLFGVEANKHNDLGASAFVEYASMPMESPTLVYDDVLSTTRVHPNSPLLMHAYTEIPLESLCNFSESRHQFYDDFQVNRIVESALENALDPDLEGTQLICGNGVLNTELGEECDPCEGILVGCDLTQAILDGYCDGTCRLKYGRCGDGESLEFDGEDCDDGNNQNGDGCSSDCHTEISEDFCGNGPPAGPEEECDDGNSDDFDACSNSCTLNNEVCGDGKIIGDEECDGGRDCSDECRANNIPLNCGNGSTPPELGEECDDGNNIGGDGCDAWCQSEELEFNDMCVPNANNECPDGSTCHQIIEAHESNVHQCLVDCASDEVCAEGYRCVATFKQSTWSSSINQVEFGEARQRCMLGPNPNARSSIQFAEVDMSDVNTVGDINLVVCVRLGFDAASEPSGTGMCTSASSTGKHAFDFIGSIGPLTHSSLEFAEVSIWNDIDGGGVTIPPGYIADPIPPGPDPEATDQKILAWGYPFDLRPQAALKSGEAQIYESTDSFAGYDAGLVKIVSHVVAE